MTDKSVVGRLAPRPYREGDSLAEVGSICLVSGANSDVESDQHRSYGWSRVIGYSPDKQFVCLQVESCWPTVERLTNCWFATESHLLAACAPDMLAALRAAERDLATVQREISGIAPEAASPALPLVRAAISKAEGRW